MFETAAVTVSAGGFSSPEASLNERGKIGGGRQKPNPRRSAFAAFIGALAAVALALSTLVAGPALAHNELSGYSWAGSGGACNQSDRLPRDSATCLTASWDNTPPAGAEYSASIFTVKNECGDIGKVVGHINILSAADFHLHLNNSTTREGGFNFSKISKISCCHNKGDKLCIRQQVEPVGGKIKYVYKKDGRYHSADRLVNTQENRYVFCSNFPDYVYCKLTDDTITPPTAWCGSDGECTREDCVNLWKGGHAYKNGCTHSWISIQLPDTTTHYMENTTCRAYTVKCKKDDGTMNDIGTLPKLYIRDFGDWHNCDGKLGNRWCQTGRIEWMLENNEHDT